MLHQIGEGSSGPVYRAYQPELDRLVAVKVFRLELAPEDLERFAGEIEKLIAADLTHPAIAAPLGTGIAGTSVYLAQDFVATDTLDMPARQGSGPVGAALQVAAQVAAALDFAAAVDVVHGALHPRDILVSADDTRLTGLGISQALEAVGAPVPLRPPYTAPERATGDPWDRRADVFSLAAVVYGLLWGRPVAGSVRETVAAIMPIGGGNAEQLRDVFAQALAAQPADRFDTALAFVDALQRCFATEDAPLAPRFDVVAEDDIGNRSVGRDDGTSLPIAMGEAVMVSRELPFLETLHDRGAMRSPSSPDGLRLSLGDPERANGADPPGQDDELSNLGLHGLEAFAHDDHEEPALAADVSVGTIGPEPVSGDGPSPSTAPGAGGAFSAVRFSEYAAERSRSAVWPLALALAIGLAVGSAATFLLLNRDRQAIGQDAGGLTVAPDMRAAAGAAGSGGAGVAARGSTDAARPGASAPGDRASSRVPPARAATPSARGSVASSETGRLVVRSTPAGARVLVDGKNVGVTPVTLSDLARGSHAIRIVRDGYMPEERRVSLTASRPSQSITAELSRTVGAEGASAPASSTPAAADRVGALSVDSRPAAAKVYVDGNLAGTTPLQLDDVAVGSHLVRIELEGYGLWSSTVRVKAGERLKVAASLER